PDPPLDTGVVRGEPRGRNEPSPQVEKEHAMHSKGLAVVWAFALTFLLSMVTPIVENVSAATLTVGNATSLPCTGTFRTISLAVTAASPGDTISVCKGTYNELVQVNKTLTIQGA